MIGMPITVAESAAESVSYRSPTSMRASGFRNSRCWPMDFIASALCSQAVPFGIFHWISMGFMSRYVDRRMPQSWRPVDRSANRISNNLAIIY